VNRETGNESGRGEVEMQDSIEYKKAMNKMEKNKPYCWGARGVVMYTGDRVLIGDKPLIDGEHRVKDDLCSTSYCIITTARDHRVGHLRPPGESRSAEAGYYLYTING